MVRGTEAGRACTSQGLGQSPVRGCPFETAADRHVGATHMVSVEQKIASNWLLRALPPEEFELIEPHLEKVRLTTGRVVLAGIPDDPLRAS
jgi:hypothetical protein